MRCVRFSPSKKSLVLTATTTAIATRHSSRKTQPGNPAVASTNLPKPMVVPSNTCLSQPPAKNQPTRIAAMGRSHVQPASLNSIGSKPVQSESKPGGRHPQPPDATNTKLKHKCPFDGCPWRFATPYKLRRHIKSHTKETPYLCKECGRGFSVRYNLLMHIQTIHSQPQRYKCPVRGCKEAFHSQPRLNGHLRRVHKKDLKTINEPDNSKAPNSRSSSTSSTDSVQPKTATRNRYECSECRRECGSQSKLNVHMRTHTGEKPFKCTVQGCEKAFASKDRLTKHTETHKHSKQFCCPHENCNRIFLRQSHLKNHLKIHTQGHFVCPVVDCSQKFGSEVGYNEHLNSHINYGHRCPHSGCQLSFPTRRRLELHCRALHGTLGASEPGLLHGAHIHPVGIPNLPPSHPHPPHPQPLPHHQAAQQHAPPPPPPASNKRDLLNFVDKEIIENVDLPGLTVEDIETVLSEHSEWSGAQIEQFLRSAVDLSEIEAKLFSMEGYESDSGYSTYDVSPITSSAPMQLNGRAPIYPTPSLSPALTPIDSAASMLSVNLSPSSPSFYHHAPLPMHPETGGSPSDDIGFLSQSSQFALIPFSSSQNDFLPAQPCPNFSSFAAHHNKPYPTSSTTASSAVNLSHISIASNANFQSEFTDLLESTSTTTTNSAMSILSSFSDLSPNGRKASDGNIMCNFFSSEAPKMAPNSNQPEMSDLPDLEKLGQESESKSQTPAQPVTINAAIKLEGEVSENCALADTRVPSPGDVPKSQSPTQAGQSPSSSGDINPLNVQMPPNFKLPPNFQLPPNSVDLPGNNLQSLLSMCSKMPVLNNMLASSSNPAVFLVAISTALSTLTKPNASEGALSANGGAGGSSGAPIDLAQLQSLVAKLGPEQLQKLALGPKLEPGQLPPPCGSIASNCHPTPAVSSSDHTPNLSNLTPPAERTVFASVLPPRAASLPMLPPMTRNGFNPAAVRNTGCYSSSDHPGSHRFAPQPQQQQRYLSNCANPMVGGSSSSVMTQQHSSKSQHQKSRLHRTSHSVSMKPAGQKRKPQWPRSMSKANLMAFREHILNKLKKTPDGVETADVSSPVSKPVIKTESRVVNCKTEVSYERNHCRCQSEPADVTDCGMDSPLSLQPCHSDSSIANTNNTSSLSELLNSSDLLSEFQFNPDTLLSPSAFPFPDDMLDGLTGLDHGCCEIMGSPQTPVNTTSADDEIKHLLGQDSQDSMEMDCIRDLLPENTLQFSAELSRVSSSNEGSPAATPRCVGTPAQVSSPGSQASPPVSGRSSAVGTPKFEFLDSLHQSVDSLTAQGHTSIRLHIEQNLDSILQTHRDPLLAGSTCGSEPFDI